MKLSPLEQALLYVPILILAGTVFLMKAQLGEFKKQHAGAVYDVIKDTVVDGCLKK